MKCQCGAVVSKNAESCPSCGKLLGEAAKTFNCRVCGATLNKRTHFFESFSQSVRDGNSTTTSSWIQRPCTSCGEPKPFPRPFYNAFMFMVRMFFYMLLLSMIVVGGVAASPKFDKFISSIFGL